MKVITVTRDPLSATHTAVCRPAFTKATLYTYVASYTSWPCHSYKKDVERRAAFQQKLINIEERQNILYYLEAEDVISR
jgi:hypothetical protein